MQQPDPGNIDGRYGEKTDKSWEWYKANNWGQVELALRNIDGDHIEKLNKKYDSQFTQGEKGNIYYPNKGTGKNKKPSTTTVTAPRTTTQPGKLESTVRLPDAVGIRWSQSASAGGGVAASQDVLVSKNGANIYGSVEGNIGAQSGGDLSSQLVLAWGTPDGIAGSYTSVNFTVVAGIGIDIQYSWSDTSRVFAIGPALGLKWQASVGKGKTFR